jgi:hypothetical protein
MLFKNALTEEREKNHRSSNAREVVQTVTVWCRLWRKGTEWTNTQNRGVID